jgi:ribosomal protein L34
MARNDAGRDQGDREWCKHVKDFSREDPGARAYRNKQELSPHTDSCDLVCLLCLRDAEALRRVRGFAHRAQETANGRRVLANRGDRFGRGYGAVILAGYWIFQTGYRGN